MLKRITLEFTTDVVSAIVDLYKSNPEYLTYSKAKIMALTTAHIFKVKVRILITGDRNWSDKKFMKRVLSNYDANNCVLVHGNCRGADTIAGDVATELGMEVEVYPANWSKYQKAAGPIRNAEMLKTDPHIILVWHDDLARSRGTKSCVTLAKKMGMESRLEYFHH